MARLIEPAMATHAGMPINAPIEKPAHERLTGGIDSQPRTTIMWFVSGFTATGVYCCQKVRANGYWDAHTQAGRLGIVRDISCSAC